MCVIIYLSKSDIFTKKIFRHNKIKHHSETHLKQNEILFFLSSLIFKDSLNESQYLYIP